MTIYREKSFTFEVHRRFDPGKRWYGLVLVSASSMEIDIPRWLSCYLHRYLNLSRESGKLLLVLEVGRLIELKFLLFIIFNIKSK